MSDNDPLTLAIREILKAERVDQATKTGTFIGQRFAEERERIAEALGLDRAEWRGELALMAAEITALRSEIASLKGGSPRAARAKLAAPVRRLR